MTWKRHTAKPFPPDDSSALPTSPRRPRSGGRLTAIAGLTQIGARGLELSRLIEELTRCIADQVGVAVVGVATRDEDADELVFRGGQGWSSALPVGAKISTQPDSPAHRIFALGKPMVIADLAADNRLKVPRGIFAHDVVSGLIAPIIRDGVPFGIVGGFSTNHRRFNPADIDFFQSVTNLLGSALENAHLRRAIARATAKAEREAASKVSFIANASHELRSPLNVILGYCEIIGELLNETGDPHAQSWMQAVERAGIRVLGTVDDIFDYSRIESGTVPRNNERLQLAPLVEAVVRAATPAAVAKRIGLSCAIDAPNVMVSADRRCLTVALTKLVGNSIKFTERGSVEVQLRIAGCDTALIEIRDSGVGIAPEYVPRLFEPFSQERDSYARPFEGIGLGLAIAHHFLELNHGHIAVETEKGRGSTFTVYLPRVEVKPSRRPSRIPLASEWSIRREPLIRRSASR